MVKFYWQYLGRAVMADIGNPAFAITPKEHFDSEGTLLDEGLDEADVPDGFYELGESTYEFDGDLEDARAVLTSSPDFEEKKIC
jgi:hypothetical protein